MHYLGKLKNQKFAILMHVKHVSNVTFYIGFVGNLLLFAAVKEFCKSTKN